MCRFVPLVVAAAIAAASPLHASKHSYEMENAAQLRRLADTVEWLRMECSNYATEMSTLQEKFRTQEETLQQLRSELDVVRKENYEEIKAVSQDSTIKKLKSHANESSDLLGKYQGMIKQLEQKVARQNQDIECMQTAMRSLMDALQIGGTEALADSGKVYQVKEGDSLGLIAQRHRTTVKEIKELNNLRNDRIIIGQKIKIPDPK